MIINRSRLCPCGRHKKAPYCRFGNKEHFLLYGQPTDLDADLILVDEVSMLDVYLAGRLFDALKYGAQLVLIGDADQLPSVGPGAVLSEMISECRHLFNHRTISEKTNSKQIKYREGNEKPLPPQPYYELSLRLEVGGLLHQPSGLFLFEFDIYK